jgi:signal transduction histidine kinase
LDGDVRAWETISLSASAASDHGGGETGSANAAMRHGPLPAPTLAAAPGPHAGSNRPLERVRPTLLVVDDEPDVLQSVHDLLRMEYHVVTCLSGAEALAFLRNSDGVHVIMSDQRMPHMSGVEVLRKAKAIRPETTRLLFTAYAEIDTVIDAINQGHVFRYLAKPWGAGELEAVVRQAVEHHDLIVEKNRLLQELKDSNARLLEANRLKGAFIQVASHELNTPVTVVLGMIELWKMAQGESASSQERQWVERIGAAAGRLARTVERMLKLIRDREFGGSLELESIDPESLVRGVVDELTPYLDLRRQSVAIELEPSLGPIEADASKLRDVLINLMANAVKFTPDGGTIRVEGRSEPDRPGWVRLSVTDQGVGVSPADQQHLFEPFFTGFDTLRHSSGDYQFGKRGIGLGLSLVKTFVELHGGQVYVCSTLGQGSTFSFVLPRLREALGQLASFLGSTALAHDRDSGGSTWQTIV